MIQFVEIKPPVYEGEEYFYRYKEVTYSLGMDQFDYPLPGSDLKVELERYRVIKRTPKGAWIDCGGWGLNSDKKLVLLDSKKRFACPTKKEALESFKARKRRQIKIVKAQLKRAEEALSAAEELGSKGE